MITERIRESSGIRRDNYRDGLTAVAATEDTRDILIEDLLAENAALRAENDLLKLRMAKGIEKLAHFGRVFFHDFRTPLAVIKGYTQLLQQRLNSGNTNPALLNEGLNSILSSEKRAESLVSGAVVRMTDLMEEPKSTPVADFLQSVSTDYENLSLIKANNVKLEVVRPVQHREIFIQNKLFIHLLRTFLLNSIHAKATEVTIWTELNGNNTIIYIEDNGAGMDEETQQSCFTPEFTTKKNTAQEGTGVGLSDVLESVKEWGGDSWVDWSEIGKGTRFTISLPINKPTSIAR